MLSLPPITVRLRGWRLIDRVALAFPLLCAIVLGEWPPVQGAQSTTTEQRAAKEDDIREAVLQHLMQDWARNGDKGEAEAKDKIEKEVAKKLNFQIFFASINDKDPSEDFLNGFRTFRES